jgi:hypothetical protein
MLNHKFEYMNTFHRNRFERVLIFCGSLLLVLLFSNFQLLVQVRADTENHLSKTYKEEALRSIPEIVREHPRIFLRRTHWGLGPNLEELRKAAGREPWTSWLKGKPSGRPAEAWALRYLLTGNESLVPPIVEYMKTVKYWPGILASVATCYDWIYHSPSFSSQDKKSIANRIVEMAEKAIVMGEEYNDMWSHFGYRPPVDIAFAGLALYGHTPEAEKYIRYGGGYIKKNLFSGWQRMGGAYQGGWSYYPQGVQGLMEFIAAWSSATNEDLYREIAIHQGNWLLNHMYYLIQTTYPDKTLVDTAGFSYTPSLVGIKSLLIIATAYKNKDGVRYLRWVGGDLTSWHYDWWPYLFFTPELRDLSIGPYEMPLAQIWGREGVGYVQMRSGRGEDDTVIEFKCGDYFWSHNSQNQNSFSMYRKGRLATQSGIYDSYWGNHMQFYYRPTISSNSILVVQPGEVSWVPPKVAQQYNIPNRNGYISEWGGQRACYIVPEHGSAETCFTFDKYLYRKDHEHHFETGHIKAFETTDRYSYVYGDATMAYNNPTFSYPANKPKLDLFTRQLVFIDKKYLIIFDRVNSLSPDYEKRWLLHSIGEPQFTGKFLSVENPGHREVYKAGLVRTDNQGGTLYCQTLFPEDYLIRKVGGSATVTAAKADPANKGNAILKTGIKGRYERISPTIASDSAQKEDWIIEFIDQEHFKIRGSITGEDGMGFQKDSMFISNSQSIFFLKDNWSGVPQKGDKFYFSVTSPSYRFWVNGKNQSPSLKAFYTIIRDGSNIDPGSWRIEVFPKKEEKFDTFLHLLYPCDRDTPNPPLAEGVVTSDNIMKGVSVDNWVVLFGHKDTVSKETKYSIKNKGNTANLLLDMKPEKPYVLNVIKEGSETRKEKVAASKEGTLFFTAPGPCRIDIAPL